MPSRRRTSRIDRIDSGIRSWAGRERERSGRVIRSCADRRSAPEKKGDACIRCTARKGSWSATIEAALTMAGAPYRMVETASWETNDAFRDLLKINPIGQIPTLVLPDGSGTVRERGDSDSSRRRASRRGLLPRDAVSARTSDPRTGVHRRQLLFGDHRYRLSRALLPGHRRRGQGPHSRRDQARLHRHWEIFADMFPGAPVPRRQRHRRAGSLRGGRDQVVGFARTSRPSIAAPFHAALLKVEAHPKVAAVFARNWPAK